MRLARFLQLMASCTAALISSTAAASRSRRQASRGFLVVRCDGRRHAGLPYSSLAAKILGPPTSFDAAKLKVEFVGGEEKRQATFPRAYILTHCDYTANLTLAVTDSGSITSEQLRRRRWQSDDVLAQWDETASGEMTLHVHCYVSGANPLQELAAGFRYYVFSKELPLVLTAVVHGDAALFAEQPELMEATVWVHFHSSSSKYDRIECWGPLKEASKRNQLRQNAITEGRRRAWELDSPEDIFDTILAFLL